LGSFQLLVWIFFHPAAWQSHIARIDPNLGVGFRLLDLRRSHWRNPDVWRLMIQTYAILPIFVFALVSFGLSLLGISGERIVLGAVYGWTLAVATSSAGALAIGMGVSIAGGVVAGFLGGLTEGIALSLAGQMSWSTVYAMASNPTISLIDATAIGVEAGIVGSLVISLAGHRSTHSISRQIGGFVIGVFISGAVLLLGGGIVGGIAQSLARGDASDIVYELVLTVGSAVVISSGLGLVIGWRTRQWLRDVALVIGFGALISGLRVLAANSASSNLAVNIVWEVIGGVPIAMMFVSLFAIPFTASEFIAGSGASALAGAIGSAGAYMAVVVIMQSDLQPILLPSLGGILLGLTLHRWRPWVFYPFMAAWNLLLHRADERLLQANKKPRWLRLHSAFWDEHQRLPMLGLEEHLLLVMESYPDEGGSAIEYLATSRQHWAAQAAQIELDARKLERCANAAEIGEAHRGLSAGELEGPASALLRSFRRLSQDIKAALQQESAYNQRLALTAVEDRLDGLLRELTRSPERYAVRFRPIANRWRQIVASHITTLAEAVALRQAIVNPYVIGVPLTAQQQIFVGRAEASARIENLLLNRGHSPLLLYGQRRMGKTSLLNNLGRLLSTTILPLYVDLQGPVSLANDEVDFLFSLARSMITSADRQRGMLLPPLSRQDLAEGPFSRFDEWLDQVEGTMDTHGQDTALLNLDEFEALVEGSKEKRFSATAMLGMLRHLIQHRLRFKVLLAASHTIEELRQWASYLINVQTVHISYLNEAETRQLVERPTRDFKLIYQPDACQRVLDLTSGHPYLVQLLCANIVALKNEQAPAVRNLARNTDVDAAVPEALAHGEFFFADIEQNQVDSKGLALLRYLATAGEKAVFDGEAFSPYSTEPDDLAPALEDLIRRELIKPVGDGYRFQVELLRRWFAQDGGAVR
jgi:hypothetical protein